MKKTIITVGALAVIAGGVVVAVDNSPKEAPVVEEVKEVVEAPVVEDVCQDRPIYIGLPSEKAVYCLNQEELDYVKQALLDEYNDTNYETEGDFDINNRELLAEVLNYEATTRGLSFENITDKEELKRQLIELLQPNQ